MMARCVLSVGWLLGMMLPLLGGCDRSQPAAPASPSDAAQSAPASNRVELLFVYGSEKKGWIEKVTASFNDAQRKLVDGKIIHVSAAAMGSGECIDEVLSGRTQAQLVSPASLAFINLGNARSRASDNTDLIVPVSAGGGFDNLVVSPVVLAMWKPMAEALGWPQRPIGWEDVLGLARDPRGWAKVGHPEWGSFKFGHTHPEYSNSGLISILAEVYAASGKARGLTEVDVSAAPVGQFVGDIEHAVVHYGSSTGFFADRMFDAGPGYLSAAVLYESSVIEAHRRQRPTAWPVVAIYPREGTFWSDHPIGLVQRPWVTDEQREAAAIYSQFLRAAPQQQQAMVYGFRPGDTSIPLSDPISPEYGIDPKQPQTTFEVPRATVVNAAVEVWRQHKKHADLVIVFDTSGSMQDEQKMPNARDGARALLSLLEDQDTISLLPFSDRPRWSGTDLKLSTSRAQATQTVGGFEPGGGTALYESVWQATQYAISRARPDRICALVVLTDGEDTANRMTFPDLQQRLRGVAETSGVRIFTIGYGSDARADVLQAIADQTHGKYYQGTPQNIRQVFKEIATFF